MRSCVRPGAGTVLAARQELLLCASGLPGGPRRREEVRGAGFSIISPFMCAGSCGFGFGVYVEWNGNGATKGCCCLRFCSGAQLVGACVDNDIRASWYVGGEFGCMVLDSSALLILQLFFAASDSRTSLEHALLTWRLLLVPAVVVRQRRSMAIGLGGVLHAFRQRVWWFFAAHSWFRACYVCRRMIAGSLPVF